MSSTQTILPGGRQRLPLHPFLFSAVAMVLWVLLTAVINPAQFGDNIEQFNWSHSVEWGYWKHPPLPTVLLAGVIALFGPSPYWTYVLAALCFVGTAFFTWKAATRLLGREAGGIAVVLLALHLGFSWRAQIYNHNTVLLLAIAACLYAVLEALDRPALWRWLLAGVCAGLAMLSKYQAVVPLTGICAALLIGGALKDKAARTGLACAIAVAALVFLPHLLWLSSNGFTTLQYARHADQHLGFGARLAKFFSFFATQVRFHFPMLAGLGLAVVFLASKTPPPAEDTVTADAAVVRAWMWGLIGIPALILTAMVLLGGVGLEGHWGLQTFQFVALAIAAKLAMTAQPVRLKSFLIAAVFIHVIGMVLYFNSGSTPQARMALKSRDRVYPAAQLVEAVVRDWQKTAGACPLAYVSGPPFESGLISVYSATFPAVLEDGDLKKSPWIKPADMTRRGAIHVAVTIQEIAALAALPGAGAMQSFDVPGRGTEAEKQRKIYWRVVPPAAPCAPV